MSLRAPGAWTVVCVAALAGCWESDALVEPAPTPADAPTKPAGPLGAALPVDGRIDLDGLSAPADVVRDPTGVVHIYAASHQDAFRVQGYAVARDRALQIELLRRTALGRVAEVLGDVSPQTIDQDIVMRTLGIEGVAQQEWALMSTTVAPWVAAFADGVSQYFEKIASGTESVSPGGTAFRPSHFEPFRPVDVFAIDKLMQFAMSWSVEQDLRASRLVASGQTLGASDDEALVRRAGIVPDLMRFAPPDPAMILRGAGTAPRSPGQPRDVDPWAAARPLLFSPALSPAFDAWNRGANMIGRPGHVGSNAWALAPWRSASGGSLLAADAHFRLSSSAPLWMVHLHITGESANPAAPYVVGAAVPGLPGVAYGFHQHLAWSPVTSYFDVADLFVEQLDPAASGVRFRNSIVPLDVREETIRVASGGDVVIEVRVVPHHGPLVPIVTDHAVAPLEPDGKALSVQWSGFAPLRDLEGSLSLVACRGVEQALTAVSFAPSSVRSYVFADPNSVMYVGPTGLVERDERALAWDALRYEGRLPCLALPGDGSAEWTDARAMTKTPFLRDPADGIVIAANADPVGGTLDNDPSNDRDANGEQAFLSCVFDAGFRQGRIQQRVSEAVSPMGLEEAAAVQGDVRSPLGARLAPRLIEAIERAERERSAPGTYPLLTQVAGSSRFAAADPAGRIELLRAWESRADYEARTGVTFADMGLTSDDRDTLGSQATLLFNAWLAHVLHGVFADELSAMGLSDVPDEVLVRSLLHLLERQPALLSSYDPELRDSILWDDASTEALESRDERLVTALLDALEWLGDHLSDDEELWRWGLVHTVRFEPFDPSMSALSIPAKSDLTFPNGFPRPGEAFTVDMASSDPISSHLSHGPDFTFSHGAALRFTVAFGASGPQARAALAGGQIADPSRANFNDGAEYWRHNATHPLFHQRDDVVSVARSREVAWSSSKDGAAD